MRKGLIIFVLVNCAIIAVLVRSVYTLLSLLIEDGSADAITRPELPAPNSSYVPSEPQIIPKIIHQTYKNNTIPEVWAEARQSCLDIHPDYEYKLWTDEKSRKFIAAEYPWFLETFDNYHYPIQRADAIRYFVLDHFGGTYIDLDDGCNRRLDPLLVYPAWVRRTSPTGISNDAMASVPKHPFFQRVIDSLQEYDRSWLLPYITVMYSTGPLFLSVIWKEYMLDERPRSEHVRILMPDEYNKHYWSFFTHHQGSSWHGKDARLIFWMGGHWMLITAAGFALAAVVGFCLWWAYGRLLFVSSRYYHRYSRLPTRPTHAARSSTSAPPSYSPTRRKLRLPALFTRSNSSKKEDEETGRGTSERYYELVGRGV